MTGREYCGEARGKKFYADVEEFQKDSIKWLKGYSRKRPHRTIGVMGRQLSKTWKP